MKRTNILFIVIFLIITIAVNAQIRRIVLLEEATNASCPPCAAYNPGLQKFIAENFGGVISVRYHASWPGKDPMYTINTKENDARIQYYGINSVPTYVLDGVNHGSPSNPDRIYQQMVEQLEKTSPVKIVVTKSFSSDSVFATVQILAEGDVSGNIKLRVAAIERRITYNTAPGSNGEKVFNDVMRKFLTSTAGEDVGTIAAGSTLTFNVSAPVNSAWKLSDIEIVAWLQNDDNKEIIQSGFSMPTFTIKSNADFAAILDYNNTYSYSYTIVNDNITPLNISVAFNQLKKPDDWNIQLAYNGNSEESFTAAISPGDSISFDLQIETGNTPGMCKVNLFAKNSDDPLEYGSGKRFFGMIPNGKILLVDDDGGKDYDTLFTNVLDELALEYSVIPEEYLAALLGNNRYDFSTLLWNVGWDFPALTSLDVSFIDSVLFNGGNLFITGQDIGWDIFDPDGSSGSAHIKDFYNNVLDAKYIEDDSKIYNIKGIPGDPISDGLDMIVYYKVHKRYPEVVSSYSGNSVNFLKYSGSSKYAGVANDAGTYKTVYVGVGFEQILEKEMRSLLLTRVLAWFGDYTDVEENVSLITDFQLQQNYPNPFNPTTAIKYSILTPPQPSPYQGEGVRDGLFVSLKVYNILGKEVATLVNKKQKSGNYKILFDGSNLPSGIYFYRLQAGKFSSTKKMILLK